MERNLYDLKTLAQAMKDASRKPPRWLIALVAPLCIVCAFVAGVWKWNMVENVCGEAAAIKDAWRR